MKTLIVEDDFTSNLVLKEILKPFGPIQSAKNGQEGVEAVRTALESGEPFDLVTLDIMMPEGMDGHQVLKEIRALEAAQGDPSKNRTKIIMTTSVSDPKSVVTALMGLADGYLVKPVDRTRMLDELRKLKLIA
jgi:two-component system chemotaxis response regulator CheY